MKFHIQVNTSLIPNFRPLTQNLGSSNCAHKLRCIKSCRTVLKTRHKGQQSPPLLQEARYYEHYDLQLYEVAIFNEVCLSICVKTQGIVNL